MTLELEALRRVASSAFELPRIFLVFPGIGGGGCCLSQEMGTTFATLWTSPLGLECPQDSPGKDNGWNAIASPEDLP